MPSAYGWDSANNNPTHATHSYLTEMGINALKSQYPELAEFQTELLAGANSELHELTVSGTEYGVDLDAKRREHKGTNAGTDDIKGWWNDAAAAYAQGNKQQAYFYVGVMLHMIEDMGVPAHAQGLEHQAIPNFDNFEFMGLSNWRPDAGTPGDKADPAYADPWRYYEFSRSWTLEDAPNYNDISAFSKTWTFANDDERMLLSNRQLRTGLVVTWALSSAVKTLGL